MNIRIIASIAKTHLFSRMKQTAIAALGVTFGIGTFITLVSFMTGLNGLLDGLILNRTPHIHIYSELVPSEKQPVDLYDEFSNAFNIIHSIQPKQNQLRIHNAIPLINDLENDPRVKGVIPQVTAQVFYMAGPIKLNGIVNGIEPEEEDRLFRLSDYVIEGSVEGLENSSSGVILGAGVAQKMGKKLHDRINVSSSSGELFSLKIVGIYQSGLAEIDDIQSYSNLKMAQRIMGQAKNYITDINVKLYDMALAPGMAKNIESDLGLTATDIIAANAQFETGTAIRNIITYAVSITLLIVAGFGIYNILNMLIYEKMNDIAILKAIGFSGQDVQRIFLTQAMIIGVVGGILGLLVGAFLSYLISITPFETEALPTISTFPVNNNPLYYVIGIGFALVSTFFAGFLPAQRARKIDPVEIIRGQ